MEQKPRWPEVKNYLQVHQYLQDVYAFRKAKESGFSYESWAAELGVSSRSHLRLSIIGRRNISDALVQLFVSNLKLVNTDKDYFLLLVLYSQSSNSSQKTHYAKKMADLISVKIEKKSVAPTLVLLKDPTVIALRLLLTFEDVSGSEEELSHQVGAPLEEIQDKLKVLRSHGLVQEESLGQWRATSKWIQFIDQADNSGIRAYHAASLEAAKRSIEFPVDTRYFRSLTWALNAEEYQSFLQDLSQFVEQMNAKYEKNILEDRKLMQLNMNLIPALGLKKSSSGSHSEK
ncbi:TIGR02147 family protein [Bdellovibrio sp. HCB337]|uniref:TIGR02147 family protein n=1 Tax=Bdellovibrio sp. HCB337 TaxID=3394358 RepID=UPI0039A481A2